MNLSEAAKLLTMIGLADNRVVTPESTRMWGLVLADVDYESASRAVVEHFRSSTEYLMPAHVVRLVEASRRMDSLSPEAPESCADGRHRWFPDGTCLFCTSRRDVPAGETIESDSRVAYDGGIITGQVED